jgi:LPPG:FO 2-phospho-L-lactate transferase
MSRFSGLSKAALMLVVLTGGTGGAKLIEGLAAEIDPAELTIICNTGDDSRFHGLYVAPDIDTITYTLAGISDSEKGWGIRGDTFGVLQQLRRLGSETWFNLGDKDLATHITRTRLMAEGLTLAEVTERIGAALNVRATILPMSNERVETRVVTPNGELPFQEFFVRERWAPAVEAVRFDGAEQSRPGPGVLEAIRQAAAIIIAPSNPITSIGPILAVAEIRRALRHSAAKVAGISPIIRGAAVSGPADKLMAACGLAPSALGVAQGYRDLLSRFVIDREDGPLRCKIESLGIRVLESAIRMTSHADKRRLAREVLVLLKK